MMKATSALALMLTAACAGDGGDDGTAALAGLWVVHLQDGCEYGVAMDADGAYEFDLACELTSGEIGVQAVAGVYAIEGNRVTFTPMRTSCIGFDDEPTDATFSFLDDGSLRLFFADSSSALVFEPLERTGSSGGAVILYGCWYEGDTFTVEEVRDI